jgi:hypothetical protein
VLLTALAAVQLAAASPGAGDLRPPDPATLVMPDMTPTRDQGAIRDGWRHFYFHKARVSYEEAFADFRDCYRFLPTAGADPSLPMFVPWSERPGAAQRPRSNYGGPVGGVILGLVSGTLDRRDRQSRMRRCLEPRGYVRYPLTEEVWRQLIDGYSERSIALQALAASRPAPDLPQVTR